MSFIDTSLELPCGTCEGTGKGLGDRHDCLVCGGKGTFPGFNPKQVFEIILTKGKGKKRTLRKHFPNIEVDDTLNARAFFVWKKIQALKGDKTAEKISTFAELGVSGDPYRVHLEKMAEVICDTLFGTNAANLDLLQLILPPIEQSELRK